MHAVTHHRKTPATTHISRLASDYVIQMVNPYDLRQACELSTDYGEDNTTSESGYTVLLQKKYENCTDWFLTNLAAIGVQEPLVVIIRPDGLWQFDDGHHRLAWALLNNVDVPVVFDDSMVEGDAIEDNLTCYYVTRHDVTARHDTTEADLADEAEELIEQTENYLTNLAEAPTDVFLAVIPRPRGSHREKSKTGGRHRMA